MGTRCNREKRNTTEKQIDVKNYVSKEVHQRLQLKYHRYFRQYDDMIDRLRDQEEMQRKCRRHDLLTCNVVRSR